MSAYLIFGGEMLWAFKKFCHEFQGINLYVGLNVGSECIWGFHEELELVMNCHMMIRWRVGVTRQWQFTHVLWCDPPLVVTREDWRRHLSDGTRVLLPLIPYI